MEAPTVQQPSASNRGQRHRRRGPPRRGQPHPPPSTPDTAPPTRTATGRAFGGQLTRLHPEAPTFVPASVSPVPPSSPQTSKSKPHTPRNTKKTPNRPPPQQHVRKASVSRSTAPDIATRIHEDILHNLYECAICTNEISRHSKVWSCRTCWTVFHIGCIKRWAKNEGSAVHRPATQDTEETPAGKQWRCPGCNLPKDTHPTAYTCWCEKELDPKPIIGLPPHSCGQTCGRERTFPKPCPHPCDLLCHAGPCPPCTAMGPKQPCFCGKEEITRRCLETNYESGWSCGSICGDLMPCGQHTCPRPCHEGLCGACTAEVDARCYCGKIEKKIQCHERGEEKPSSDWTGSFDCGEPCARLMDCGIHKCDKRCHPQESDPPHCPTSVDVVTHCPCGKTALSELNIEPRTLCTDPIPSCQKECGRKLSCGHHCTQTCHTGECKPCDLRIRVPCRCGRNSFDVICHEATQEPPQCTRLCKATLNCGRHECGERCCTGERKASERQATRRKLKPLGAIPRSFDDNIEAEHICTRACGRKLKCGNHNCTDLCHRGPCGSCKEAIFDDISCSCGRTVLQAPLPCGTQPPPCNFPCARRKACGHPQVAHNCHSEEEGCPKCPFLTEKDCLCGKKTLKNQPCWRSDVLCGLVCGKVLKCGSHTCRKTCHKPGDCEDAHQHCQQECGKAKKACGHPCEQPCHAPSVCKENKPCPFKVMITCDCQRKKEEVRCNARASLPEPPGRQTSLKCDDECARLERNRKLALALHISDDHTDDHVPYSTTTLKMYLEDVAWAHKQEETLRLFAADETQKRLTFQPMKSRQRAFIHSIAEDFGFDGESLDPEPHRHVVLFKTPKFVSAPMKTLAQAARIKRGQLNISAPVHSTVERKADEVKHEYNGLLLLKPKFALTEDELRPVLKRAAPATDLDIFFLPDDQGVALILSMSWDTPEDRVTLLTNLQPNISDEVIKHNLASSVVLCQFDLSDSEPKVLQQQGKPTTTATNGWSQVAARKAAPAQAPQIKPVGQRPVYTVLGSRLAEAKRKKQENEERLQRQAQQQDVVEDWEQEIEREEHDEAERRASQGQDSSDGAGAVGEE